MLFDIDNLTSTLVYNIEQENILLNSICSEITLYSGESSKSFGPLYEGLSLYEYYQKDYSPFCYLPRKLFLKYLEDFIQKQLTRLKELNITYKIIKEEVIFIKKQKELPNFKIYTNLANEFYANNVVLSTGHGVSSYIKNNNKFYDILNVGDIKSKIEPKSKVIIKGMGLTTFDLISEFTEGLGGKFNRNKNNEL